MLPRIGVRYLSGVYLVPEGWRVVADLVGSWAEDEDGYIRKRPRKEGK